MQLIFPSSLAPLVITSVSRVSSVIRLLRVPIQTILAGQAKGDGDPSCFTKTEDTGVPALQEWCHHLTVSSRERAARNFLTHLKTFANSVKTYVEGVGDVTAADRESLRAKWESNLADMMDVDEPMAYDGGWPGSDDPFSIEGLAMLADPRARAGLYAVDKKPKINSGGDLVGVTPRLIKVGNDAINLAQKNVLTIVFVGVCQCC